MEEIRSVHLQKNVGWVLSAAERDPVVLLNRGQPRSVVMSVQEFRRLKQAAHELVPTAALPREPKLVRLAQAEPLDYETTNFWGSVSRIASDVLAGETEHSIAKEAARFSTALSRFEGGIKSVQPEFLISDTYPISVLSLLGVDGLDLLLATPARVVITDVVLDELLEPPEPGSDASLIRRAEIAAWVGRRRSEGLISEMLTNAGRLFRAAQANWNALGCPPDTRPSRKDLGEASVVSTLSALTERAGSERTVFVLMDDRAGRAAVRVLGAANIDLMGIAAYLHVVEENYGAVRAGEAWLAIAAVANERLDHGVMGDPVLIRR